jgi:hypothetical protein
LPAFFIHSSCGPRNVTCGRYFSSKHGNFFQTFHGTIHWKCNTMVRRMICLYLQNRYYITKLVHMHSGLYHSAVSTAKSTINVACCDTLLIFGHWILCTYTTEQYLIDNEHQIWIQMIVSSIVIHHLDMILNNLLWQCGQVFFLRFC